MALAFENVRLFQRTRELSITDEVTPLHNFRYFHQALDRELKLVNRYGSTLSLLFVDLDRFKPINDQYGHLRGSRTLREVGFLIRAAVRETDIPARYGGDEFVVILPQTDGPSARVLAEKLRRLVEGHTFLQEEGINARLGVSLGVANYPEEATTKEALIRLADKRMYEDKDVPEDGAVIESAGTLLYRRNGGKLEVLIVHPWGPYNRRAPWSIPKGRINPGEDLEVAARRETEEETGVRPGSLHSIGSVDLARSRKRIHGFTGPAPEDAGAPLRPEGGRRGEVRARSTARASSSTRPRSRSSTGCSRRSTASTRLLARRRRSAAISM